MSSYLTEQTIRLIECANAYRGASDDVASCWTLIIRTDPGTPVRAEARRAYDEARERQESARMSLLICGRAGGT